MTGLAAPFEGIGGLCELLRIEVPNLDQLGAPIEGLSAVEATGIKVYPAEYSAQGPVSLALQLREHCRCEDIARVDIALHWGGWHEIGGGQGDRQDKWNPTTREAADHSLPYMVAVALADGDVSLRSYDDARLHDRKLRRLMQLITVSEDPELTREHAGELPSWPSTMQIVLNSGETLRAKIRDPKGHPRNPLSDAELAAKFFALSDGVIHRSQAQRLLDLVGSLHTARDVSLLTDQFRTI